MGILDSIFKRRPRLKQIFDDLELRIDCATAVKNFARDDSRWHKAGVDPFDKDGSFACQRLRQPTFLPALHPEFRIDKNDRLFAIGSCFARGIESALKLHGFQVESAATDFDSFEPSGNKRTRALGFTNKFTTHSMLNELSWALDPAAEFPEASLVDLDDRRCIDPHINPTLAVVDRAGTLQRRRIIGEVNRRIRGCRVVFFTLGLVETWYDKLAGISLNMTPTVEMRSLHPDRYECRVTSYLQNLENMERMHELLTTYGHPEVQIVVTTSPVPFQATFSGQDVVIANTYSKATLRAVAQDFASLHDNVHYFPSYEIVMNSDRAVAWEDDLRHVQGALTLEIMDQFMRYFVKG